MTVDATSGPSAPPALFRGEPCAWLTRCTNVATHQAVHPFFLWVPACDVCDPPTVRTNYGAGDLNDLEAEQDADWGAVTSVPSSFEHPADWDARDFDRPDTDVQDRWLDADFDCPAIDSEED